MSENAELDECAKDLAAVLRELNRVKIENELLYLERSKIKCQLEDLKAKCAPSE